MQAFNSKEIWDDMFRSSTWEKNNGREQTTLFINAAMQLLPATFKEEIRTNKLSIADYGCAEGEAVPILHQHFPDSKVSGIDYSEGAIERATGYYPQYTFKCMDQDTMDTSYDVIYTSNVLEHFLDPFVIVEKLLAYTNKYFIMLVPFGETGGHGMHEFGFNDQNVPRAIGDFEVVHYQVAYVNSTLWWGNQLLCIYAKKQVTE